MRGMLSTICSTRPNSKSKKKIRLQRLLKLYNKTTKINFDAIFDNNIQNIFIIMRPYAEEISYILSDISSASPQSGATFCYQI